MKLQVYALCFLTLWIKPVLSCTNITVTAKDNSVIVGRTLEFGPPLQSELVTSNRKRVFTNLAPNGKPSLKWTAKYGYVYLNAFHQDFAMDGINEKGLSIGFLYLPGYTEYPEPTEENIKHGIPYQRLGDWILSQFDTVEQVREALNKITVFRQSIQISGHGEVIFPLHTIVTDANGNSIVIEFNKGKMQIYDNPAGLLTNSPTFDWQMTNLKNFTNLSPYAVKPIEIGGFQYSGTGQGDGMVGLPGDTTPPSRFVRMAFLTQTALPVNTAEQAIVLTNHIIGNVFIPNGFVRGVKGSNDTETTQWTVIKDLKNLRLYFKSYDYPMLQSINLQKLDFNPQAPILRLTVNNPASLSMDRTELFKNKSQKQKLSQ